MKKNMRCRWRCFNANANQRALPGNDRNYLFDSNKTGDLSIGKVKSKLL
jgi:hypothetical protein